MRVLLDAIVFDVRRDEKRIIDKCLRVCAVVCSAFAVTDHSGEHDKNSRQFVWTFGACSNMSRSADRAHAALFALGCLSGAFFFSLAGLQFNTRF